MSDIDVYLYISNFKTFFKDNPDQLFKLIGNADIDVFFNEVEKLAKKNKKNGEMVDLTKKQITNIVLKLNNVKPVKEETSIFLDGLFSTICLN